jgi:hypothetical protein
MVEEAAESPPAWLFPLEHSDLLPEGEDFERGVTSTAEEDADCCQEGYHEFEHVPHLTTLCAQLHRPWPQMVDSSALQGFGSHSFYGSPRRATPEVPSAKDSAPALAR